MDTQIKICSDEYTDLICDGDLIVDIVLEPLLKELEKSPLTVQKKATVIEEGVRNVVKIYLKVFETNDYDPRDKGKPDMLFSRIFVINKNIENLNKNEFDGSLPYIEIGPEHDEYKTARQKADFTHFTKNEPRYWL